MCQKKLSPLKIKRMIAIPWPLLTHSTNQSLPFPNLRFLFHFLFTNPKYRISFSISPFPTSIDSCFSVSRQSSFLILLFRSLSRFGPRTLCLLPDCPLFLGFGFNKVEVVRNLRDLQVIIISLVLSFKLINDVYINIATCV